MPHHDNEPPEDEDRFLPRGWKRQLFQSCWQFASATVGALTLLYTQTQKMPQTADEWFGAGLAGAGAALLIWGGSKIPVGEKTAP